MHSMLVRTRELTEIFVVMSMRAYLPLEDKYLIWAICSLPQTSSFSGQTVGVTVSLYICLR